MEQYMEMNEEKEINLFGEEPQIGVPVTPSPGGGQGWKWASFGSWKYYVPTRRCYRIVLQK